MKYYETHFEEYCRKVDAHNYHPTLAKPTCNQVIDMPNQIFYGPTGCGKYSQVLRWIQHFSPSRLKYDQRMVATTDKSEYTYRISDIHYEVDIAMLGCNSKTLWEAVFNQILDIVSVRADKSAIIVCKNFHTIHNELLDIFYSYMRQYQHRNHLFNKNNVCIKYVLITEHLSFIPASILRECQLKKMGRPLKTDLKRNRSPNTQFWLEQFEPECILNLKELEVLHYIPPNQELPCDIFNKICNQILQQILNTGKKGETDTKKGDVETKGRDSDTFDFLGFRDLLYHISIYHLDVLECLTYILVNLVRENEIADEQMHDILFEIMQFLAYFNNNYRTIYHIERIFVFIILKRMQSLE